MDKDVLEGQVDAFVEDEDGNLEVNDELVE
jgi:hypothetical protein